MMLGGGRRYSLTYVSPQIPQIIISIATISLHARARV